jgi:2-succinyl-5-enolpyruvyl-6-hydroxy-3-cyclohexene-1-carboxylate synthase
MPDENLNAFWGRCLAEELDRAGCRHVVLCPGSRNSPLLFALAKVFDGRFTTHWDERGAAFFALGMAKAERAPVAVCVTSGTAAANLLPAVCEADAAGVPLVLLTADRPPELHGCGAPQTMTQTGLFGVFADEVAIGEAAAEDAALQRLRDGVSAVARARRPVHLNLPLRDPLPPIPDGWTCPSLSERSLDAPRSSPVRPGSVLDLGAPGRGLIIAGPAESLAPSLVARLAQTTGFPVLADACSGLRRHDIPHLAACPDALYARPPAAPDVIIRIGPPPLTRTGYEWLARQRCPQLVLGGPRNDDFIGTATQRLVDPDGIAIDRLLASLGRADPAWTALWRNRLPTTSGWNATAATAVTCAAPCNLLWLASSMPVRDANLVLPPGERRVLCNRGLNGIDGTIASFLGASRGRRGICLVGDLACLHDLNSLALSGGEGAIVVLNNGGGAIFDFLPVAQVAGYRQLVRTDHDLDFAHAAAQFRLPYVRCGDASSLAAALQRPGLSLIECDLRGSDGVAAHRAALASAMP